MRLADAISISGAAFSLLGALFIDNLPVAFFFFTLSFLSDALDGYVARKQGPTAKGAFIDALCDRISDSALFGALALARPFPQNILSTLLLGVVFLPAYIRALAVYAGVAPQKEAKKWGGIGGRRWRAPIIIIGLGLLLFGIDLLTEILALLITATLITAAGRVGKALSF